MRRLDSIARILLMLLLASLLAPSLWPGAAKAEEPSRRERGLAEPEAVERWRGASGAERRAMRAAMRERLQDASPAERRRLGRRMRALERRLPEFSTIERLVLVRVVLSLPEAERRALRERIEGIDDLAPSARAELVAELRQRIAADSREVDRLERNTTRWRDMSKAERAEMREQLERLRGMSVEERRALLEEMDRKRRRED